MYEQLDDFDRYFAVAPGVWTCIDELDYGVARELAFDFNFGIWGREPGVFMVDVYIDDVRIGACEPAVAVSDGFIQFELNILPAAEVGLHGVGGGEGVEMVVAVVLRPFPIFIVATLIPAFEKSFAVLLTVVVID